MNKTQKQTSKIVSFLLISPLFISGCDTFRNTFGLDHYSPDEMSTAAPSPALIIPPGFNERPLLPPPTPGSPNPHIIPDSVKAKKTVLGDAASQEASASTTKGEKDIIEKASENQTVTPNIRSLIDEESQTDSKEVTKSKDKLIISVLAGMQLPLNGQLIYGAEISKNLLGPFIEKILSKFGDILFYCVLSYFSFMSGQ